MWLRKCLREQRKASLSRDVATEVGTSVTERGNGFGCQVIVQETNARACGQFVAHGFFPRCGWTRHEDQIGPDERRLTPS